jgi:hypothetical protein
VAEVLTFLERADGTLVAKSALATADGLTVNMVGQTVTTTPTAPTDALSIVTTDDKGNEVQQLFGPGYTGSLVQGAAKLAQRFLVHFLTPLGSIPYRAKQGSLFMKRLGQGMANESDILAAFSASLLTLLPNMQAEETSSDPADERFVGAQVTAITLEQTKLTISIKVVNRTGTAAKISLPLEFAL